MRAIYLNYLKTYKLSQFNATNKKTQSGGSKMSWCRTFFKIFKNYCFSKFL